MSFNSNWNFPPPCVHEENSIQNPAVMVANQTLKIGMTESAMEFEGDGMNQLKSATN